MRHRRIFTIAALPAVFAAALGALLPFAMARAGTHVHTADCYEGTLHICSGSADGGGGCYADSPSACPNGCILHTCQGSIWSGGACYDGGSSSTCGTCGGSGTVECSACNGTGSRACTGSWTYVDSYEEDCGWCIGTIYAHKEGVSNSRYRCSSCGATYEYRPAAICQRTNEFTNGCNNSNCSANHEQPCSYTYPYGNSHNSVSCPTTQQCGTCGGSGYVTAYSKNCGKASGRYYVGDSLCPYCGGDGKYYEKTCGMASGEYYDGMGNKCEPVCGMVVTGLVATEASQTLNAGETPVFTAEATFLDGHVETVSCDASGYSAALYDIVQDVTLSYGAYQGTAKTKGKTSVSISVYINGYFSLTLASENTAKGTVSLTGGIPEGGADAGSVIAKVLAGTKPTLTATPKEGFSFAGWYWGLTKVSSSASYQPTMPAHDYALTAKFLGKEVTVSFRTEGGGYCAPVRANYMSAYGRLPVPEKEGYVFLGWAYGGSQVTGSSPVSVAEDHTLVAQWTERGPDYIVAQYGSYYGVNDWAKDKGYVTGSNPYGALPLRVPAMFPQPAETKAGYTFLDWYLDETDGRLSAVREESKVINSTRVQINETHWLYATWKEKEFTVSFEPNGGNPCGSITVAYDRKYGFLSPLPIPVRNGYTFTGWYVSSIGGNGDGTQVTDETRVQLLSDQTLYAGWTQDAVEVPVRFEPRTQGQVGLSAEESKALGFGSTVGILAEGAPERTVTYPGTYGGYALIWCSCTEDEHSTLPEYGGRHYDIDYSSPYAELPVAMRTGYTFTGWEYGEAAVTDKTNTLASFGHTLFATYIPDTYEVSLDGRGATKQEQDSATMTFDAALPPVEVPEKTGYTFHGYFTETRGGGTQYYDADGNGTREWLEDSVGVAVLYAYWVLDDIALPEAGDREEPEELPELEVEGSVRRTDAKALLYADDYDPHTDALTDFQPYLTYDTPASEGAIPGTEQVALRARMGAWELDYRFRRRSGKDYVRIYVTVPYRTQYELDSEELVISEQKTATYAYVIPKAWSYWEVMGSGMYYPDRLTVTNLALKDVTVTANVIRDGSFSAGAPSYEVVSYGGKENHISWDAYDADGMAMLTITLTEEQYIVSGVPNTPPDIGPHLDVVCANAAWGDERQADVRNDRYVFGGETILSDAWNPDGNGSMLEEDKLPDGPDEIMLTSYLQTYLSGLELDQYKPNGTYGTSAVITYVGDAANVGMPEEKEAVLTDVNGLRIHTPVACEGVIVEGMDGSVLTLRDKLNFFTLRVDNFGTHVKKLGYGYRDFLTALSGKSNAAMDGPSCLNQVRFPFDVYVDMGEDTLKDDGTYDTTGDFYVRAGTWLTIGSQEKRFYVPVFQEDGEYEIAFRTVAVNCPQADGAYETGRAQPSANTDPSAYVATDSLKITVKLSVDDFEITNTNDPSAKEALLGGTQALILKTGYKFAYKLTTLGSFMGNDNLAVMVPSYYYVSKDGTERTAVDVYYSEMIAGEKRNFVLVGSEDDAANIHAVRNNSSFLSIRDGLMARTQALDGSSRFAGTSVDMYTFRRISLNRYVRMFPGMDLTGLPVRYCPACRVAYRADEAALCSHALSNAPLASAADRLVQEWYGEYALPMTPYVVLKDTMAGYCSTCGTARYVTGGKAAGSCGHALSGLKKFDFAEYASVNTISGDEEFFKHDGYLAVSFDIMVKGDSGEWYAFEGWEKTGIASDFAEMARYEHGDVVWYDLSKSSGDDYEVGGVE